MLGKKQFIFGYYTFWVFFKDCDDQMGRGKNYFIFLPQS
jgi:hypothetical protein